MSFIVNLRKTINYETYRYISYILFINYLLANGQTVDMTREFNVTPPPPEVASLMKHVEIPVSHFSGLPEIFGETNTKLEEQIKIVVNQALKNYENR